MAIEIYAYEPAPKGALFPNIESSLKLHAVAQLDMKDQVEVWCASANEEAENAGVTRRFKYVVTDVEVWAQSEET